MASHLISARLIKGNARLIFSNVNRNKPYLSHVFYTAYIVAESRDSRVERKEFAICFCLGMIRRIAGGMAERLKAPVLKTGKV